MIGRPRPAVNPQLCRRRLAGRCPNRVYAPGESRRGLASKTASLRNVARVLVATAPQLQLIGKKNQVKQRRFSCVGQILAVPNFVNGSGEHA